jgi:hypothetical protein
MSVLRTHGNLAARKTLPRSLSGAAGAVMALGGLGQLRYLLAALVLQQLHRLTNRVVYTHVRGAA